MVLETIEASSEDTIVLRFNPWLCSDPKQLITQFFKQLASAIKIKEKTSDKVWQLIDNYSDILEVSNGVTAAGIILTTIAKILGKKAKTYTEKNGSDLQKKKNEIIKHLLDEEVKIIVSIDDIDRLSEDEIIAVFQLIKSLADFPNTMYLLAFDYDVVIKALTKVQHGDGGEYLQKIIQVPFALPKANIDNIQKILFDKLNHILINYPEQKFDKAIWIELYQYGIKLYIKSIRDVIRFTNVFSLKYELLKGETDVVDLLGLTCLQVFEPPVYEILPFYKDVLCGNTTSNYSNQRQAQLDKIKKISEIIISKANIETKSAAEQIVNILFPNLNSNLAHNGRVYHRARFFVNRNIAAPEYFDRYFCLTLDPNDIPSSVIENLIFNADEVEATLIIQDIYIHGNIEKLLNAIEAYCNQEHQIHITPEHARILIDCLVKQWENFIPPEESSFFSIPFDWHLLFCVEPMLEILEQEKRFPVIERFFLDGNISIKTLSLLLNNFERQHNRFVDEPKERDTPLLTLDNVLALEKLFTNKMCSEIENGTLLQHNDVMQSIWLFEQISPELAKEKTAIMITNDLSLALLIHNCVGHGAVATRMVYKTWDVSMKSIEQYISLDEAYQRMYRFVQQPDFLMLPQHSQEDIVAFIIKMEQRNVPGHDMSLGITADTIQKKFHELVPPRL